MKFLDGCEVLSLLLFHGPAGKLILSYYYPSLLSRCICIICICCFVGTRFSSTKPQWFLKLLENFGLNTAFFSNCVHHNSPCSLTHRPQRTMKILPNPCYNCNVVDVCDYMTLKCFFRDPIPVLLINSKGACINRL